MTQSWLARMAEILGEVDHAALVRAFAGRRLHIPAKIGEAHPIAQIVGLAQAQKLAAEMSGLDIEIPMGAALRAAVQGDLRNGMKVRQIMQRRLCSRRFVQTLRADMEAKGDIGPETPPEPDQPSLF